jgi:glucose/arabinose dehydrogenase
MKIQIVAITLLAGSWAFSQNAESLYQKHCSSCHGTGAKGGNAKSLFDEVWQFGNSRDEINRTIKFGIEHVGMPAYEKTLDDTQINAITSDLLEPKKQPVAAKSTLPESLTTLDYDIKVEIVAEGLDVPWSLAFFDKDTALVTERSGQLRTIENGRLYSKPIEGTPEVVAEGQGGLLAVAIDPDYREEGNQWIYLAFSHGLELQPNGKRSPAMTKLVRGRINGSNWVDEETLFEAPHETYRTTRHHYGTRIVFDENKNLFFCIGDRGTGAHAQDLSKPNGKIHRIQRDGHIPRDNPFRRTKTAMPTIFSYGHRNPQGLAFHPQTGELWSAEHGPLGGDEINRIGPGKNYGWPIITYGKNYNGTTITDIVRKEGMEQPVWYWNPSTAVCAIDFYQGDLFPKWNNKLLVGSLKYQDVRLLKIENDRIMHEEIILKDAGRVRDVVCGSDGAVYIVLNDPGTILRLTPKKKI